MASTRFTVQHEPTTGEINIFFDFVKQADMGVYKCKAENRYGSDETEARLFIIDVPNIDYRPQTGNPDAFKNLDLPLLPVDQDIDQKYDMQPPIVIVPLADQLIREGVPVELACKIIGNPKPKVL